MANVPIREEEIFAQVRSMQEQIVVLRHVNRVRAVLAEIVFQIQKQ
jgi:hypothetical protein